MHYRDSQKEKQARSARRAARVRATISGTAERPRLSVSRSIQFIRVQLVDDVAKRTLVSATDAGAKKADLPDAGTRVGKVARAFSVGKLLGERAKKAGITQVVFDRGGRPYHGRIQAVAEGAREAGLVF